MVTEAMGLAPPYRLVLSCGVVLSSCHAMLLNGRARSHCVIDKYPLGNIPEAPGTRIVGPVMAEVPSGPTRHEITTCLLRVPGNFDILWGWRPCLVISVGTGNMSGRHGAPVLSCPVNFDWYGITGAHSCWHRQFRFQTWRVCRRIVFTASVPPWAFHSPREGMSGYSRT